jgi:DNA-binding NtrC family response regulator
LQNQYKLVQYLRNKTLPDNENWVDTRIIVYSSKNLSEMKDRYTFRTDLYYVLKSLKFSIPSLRERREDVSCLLDEYIQRYMKMYERYHVLTGGARKVLLDYPWDGNSIQLQAFCERMILTANKRSITEEYVRTLLDELYNEEERYSGQKGNGTSTDENEAEDMGDPIRGLIDQTLRKYNGNRTLTAKELRMSTTTLWRKMKKFGLE